MPASPIQIPRQPPPSLRNSISRSKAKTVVPYSTFFGGCGFSIVGSGFLTGSIGVGDIPTDLAVVNGKVFITGVTTAGGQSTFPLSGNSNVCDTNNIFLDKNQSAGINIASATVPLTAFVTKLDPTLAPANQLAFSVLLGGTGLFDAAGGLAVDPTGTNPNIAVSGLTFSDDFPVTPINAFQQVNNAKNAVTQDGTGSTNAFLTVLNPNGTTCLPTPMPSPTPSLTPTKTPTPIPTPSPTPTPTPSPTPTPLPGKIAVAPPSVGFMNVGTGLNKVKTVTIKNSAKTGVLKGNTAVSGNFFTITAGNGPFNLTAGQSQPVTVTFAPTAAGAAKGTLAITSNDPNKAIVNVKLTGAGQAGKLGVPVSVLFPTTTSTKPASNKTFTIKNTGLGVLQGTLGAITGTGNSFRTSPPTSGFTLQHL